MGIKCNIDVSDTEVTYKDVDPYDLFSYGGGLYLKLHYKEDGAYYDLDVKSGDLTEQLYPPDRVTIVKKNATMTIS
jgi:hypothetical protein